MDVTGKTVTSGSMLSGTTALKNDGTDITGNIQSKSASDITNSVGSDNKLTVTAPAGYYSANATKTIQAASVTIGLNKGTASNHQITVSATKGLSSGYLNSTSQITTDSVSVSASELVSGTKSITSSGTTDVTNYASASVAAGSATTPATTVTANPSISVSSGGLITATTSATKSVTPTVSAGYVSSGTAGTITVSGSNTSQLSTQAGATISPTESEQTAVSAGKYTTGAIKVGAISSTYVGSGITQRSSSDLTVSGVTVTAPAGYYSSGATIDLAIENKLPDFATYSTTTLRGVTFTWTNGQCAITGSNTGTNPSYNALYNSTTELPSALVAGNSYYLGLKWNRTPTAFIRLYCYNSQGSAVTNLILRDSSVITIPSNAVGLILRVEVAKDESGANGDILKDIILLSIT